MSAQACDVEGEHHLFILEDDDLIVIIARGVDPEHLNAAAALARDIGLVLAGALPNPF